MPSCAAWGETGSISSDWVKRPKLTETNGKTSKMEIHLSSTFGEERAFSVELFSVVGERNAADLPEEGLEDVVAQIL